MARRCPGCRPPQRSNRSPRGYDSPQKPASHRHRLPNYVQSASSHDRSTVCRGSRRRLGDRRKAVGEPGNPPQSTQADALGASRLCVDDSPFSPSAVQCRADTVTFCVFPKSSPTLQQEDPPHVVVNPTSSASKRLCTIATGRTISPSTRLGGSDLVDPRGRCRSDRPGTTPLAKRIWPRTVLRITRLPRPRGLGFTSDWGSDATGQQNVT